MKYKKMVEIIAESYEEEQFLLTRFPDAWWGHRDNLTSFYVPESRLVDVKNIVNEYKEMKKK